MGDGDLEDIHASDLEDVESDDGDIEEADYITSSGKAKLVSRSVMVSRAACEEDADKPALCNSLLWMTKELSRP